MPTARHQGETLIDVYTTQNVTRTNRRAGGGRNKRGGDRTHLIRRLLRRFDDFQSGLVKTSVLQTF